MAMTRPQLINKVVMNKFSEVANYFESVVPFNATLKDKINDLQTFKANVISKRHYGSMESFWNAHNEKLQAYSKLQNDLLAEVLEHINVFYDFPVLD